tara:strand:- start:199 stop:498 length:300 start_codon:yes stop_codon:yes gene_type:complete
MRSKVSIKVQDFLAESGEWVVNNANSLIELDRDTMDALVKHLTSRPGYRCLTSEQTHAEIVDFIGDAVHEKLEKLEIQRAEERRKETDRVMGDEWDFLS